MPFISRKAAETDHSAGAFGELPVVPRKNADERKHCRVYYCKQDICVDGHKRERQPVEQRNGQQNRHCVADGSFEHFVFQAFGDWQWCAVDEQSRPEADNPERREHNQREQVGRRLPRCGVAADFKVGDAAFGQQLFVFQRIGVYIGNRFRLFGFPFVEFCKKHFVGFQHIGEVIGIQTVVGGKTPSVEAADEIDGFVVVQIGDVEH